MTFFGFVPTWFRQTVWLILVYIVVLIAAAEWMPWQDWDMRLYAANASAHTSLNDRILFVDVMSHGELDPSPQDETIAAFLTDLKKSGQHPSNVYVDFAFLPCPTSACAIAHRHIASALDALKAKPTEVKVYGVERVPVDNRNVPNAPLVTPAPDLYAPDGPGHFWGVGHTNVFVNVDGVLQYRKCYASVEIDTLSSQVRHVTRQPVWSELWVGDAHGPCDESQLPIPVGPRVTTADPSVYATIPRKSPPYYAITFQHPFPSSADFSNRDVIVGTSIYDMPLQGIQPGQAAGTLAWEKLRGSAESLNIPGSEIVAWALNAKDATAMDSHVRFLAAEFGFLTALAFAGVFFLLRRLKLRRGRVYVSWIAAAVSCCVSLGLFVVSLQVTLTHWAPQISLTGFSIVLAGTLCAVRGNQIISASPPTSTDDVPDYDVFISYSHRDDKWVRENVVGPFQRARLPNGKALGVFFDRDSLVAGDMWRPQLTHAILNSRLVVAVYSHNYFREEERGYCRFELECAFNKWIQTGNKRYLRPIMFGDPAIPQEFSQLQSASFDSQPEVVSSLIADLIDVLGTNHPSTNTKQGR